MLSRTAPRLPSPFVSTCKARRSFVEPTSRAPSHSPAAPSPGAGSAARRAVVGSTNANRHTASFNWNRFIFISLLGLIVRARIEDLLDRAPEESRDAKSEGQAGVVLSFLDGVDRLARDLQSLGQVGLRPVAFGAQHLQPVLHEYLRQPTTMPTVWVTSIREKM